MNRMDELLQVQNSPKHVVLQRVEVKYKDKNQEILKISKISKGLGQREKGLMIHLEEKMRREGPRDRKAPLKNYIYQEVGVPFVDTQTSQGSGAPRPTQ